MRVGCSTLYPHFFVFSQKNIAKAGNFKFVSKSYMTFVSRKTNTTKFIKENIMKRVYLLAISIFALLSLNSCDKYDDYSDMMLYSNSEDIKSTVVELYPQARIVEMDKDRRTIEVDIIDSNNIKRDVYLDLSFNWIRTETDISRNALTVEVTDKIAGKYAGWFIDSVKQIDSPQGSYYLVEIEKGERDKYIKIEANGNIL
jgi:hypothetical protein